MSPVNFCGEEMDCTMFVHEHWIGSGFCHYYDYCPWKYPSKIHDISRAFPSFRILALFGGDLFATSLSRPCYTWRHCRELVEWIKKVLDCALFCAKQTHARHWAPEGMMQCLLAKRQGRSDERLQTGWQESHVYQKTIHQPLRADNETHSWYRRSSETILYSEHIFVVDGSKSVSTRSSGVEGLYSLSIGYDEQINWVN